MPTACTNVSLPFLPQQRAYSQFARTRGLAATAAKGLGFQPDISQPQPEIRPCMSGNLAIMWPGVAAIASYYL